MKTEIIKERVDSWLERDPSLRDDDNRLIANIWAEDLVKEGFSITELRPILSMVAKGKLTNPESIRRSRQKIQQDNPLLRGKYYENNKEVRTREVQKELYGSK